MNLVTFAGPPSSGKTAVILRTILALRRRGIAAGVIKFDCLNTDDDQVYGSEGIPVRSALSYSLCPDHFFANYLQDFLDWGNAERLNLLITESAGLCNRCSPFLDGIRAVCVIDNLSGINAPVKIGPMLTTADIVVITKGDIVSQAEREVFAAKINAVNSGAAILHVNGLNGQGAFELSTLLEEADQKLTTTKGMHLRYDMPSAFCSFCYGKRILDGRKESPRRI